MALIAVNIFGHQKKKAKMARRANMLEKARLMAPEVQVMPGRTSTTAMATDPPQAVYLVSPLRQVLASPLQTEV